MIELLLRLRADPNHRDDSAFDQDKDVTVVPYTAGYTLLGLTARNGWYQAAELLLKHGADPGVPRIDGALPADIAGEHGHPRTASLIRKHMMRKPANDAKNRRSGWRKR